MSIQEVLKVEFPNEPQLTLSDSTEFTATTFPDGMTVADERDPDHSDNTARLNGQNPNIRYLSNEKALENPDGFRDALADYVRICNRLRVEFEITSIGEHELNKIIPATTKNWFNNVIDNKPQDVRQLIESRKKISAGKNKNHKYTVWKSTDAPTTEWKTKVRPTQNDQKSSPRVEKVDRQRTPRKVYRSTKLHKNQVSPISNSNFDYQTQNQQFQVQHQQSFSTPIQPFNHYQNNQFHHQNFHHQQNNLQNFYPQNFYQHQPMGPTGQYYMNGNQSQLQTTEPRIVLPAEKKMRRTLFHKVVKEMEKMIDEDQNNNYVFE